MSQDLKRLTHEVQLDRSLIKRVNLLHRSSSSFNHVSSLLLHAGLMLGSVSKWHVEMSFLTVRKSVHSDLRRRPQERLIAPCAPSLSSAAYRLCAPWSIKAMRSLENFLCRPRDCAGLSPTARWTQPWRHTRHASRATRSHFGPYCCRISPALTT